MKDYYAILGVQRQATDRTIHETYKRLVRKYSSIEAQEIINEISEAYEILSDPELKAKYDNSLPHVIQQGPPAYETNTQRLNRLKKENAHIFAWCCKIGLAIAILIGVDVLVPPQVSAEEIADIQYRSGGGGRFRYHWIEVYTYDRSFKLYRGTLAEVEVGRVVTLRISRLFRNVLSIQARSSNSVVWVARLYTNLSFFPIILLIASIGGVYFKGKIDWVLSFGTVSFATGSICLMLVI